jgi:hypothetical protein
MLVPLTLSRETGRRSAEAMQPFFDDLARWDALEQELVRDGLPVPLEHRSSWIRDIGDSEYRFFVARDEGSGSILAAVPVRRQVTRALPGHYHAGVSRFGYRQDLRGLRTILGSLREWVSSDPRLLGANIELFEPDEARRGKIDEAALSLGYERASEPHRYTRTMRVDLGPTEEDVLGSFGASCRRFIRDPAKKGYRIEPITEGRWAGRMHELFVETLERTGGSLGAPDWTRLIAFGRDHPALFRIVGTFAPSYPDEASLVAFASARNNGDHAVYTDSASTRRLDTTVAVHYAPMWALMAWAKEQGCTWFDLGGITDGTQGSADPVGGISDFKRRFNGEEVQVGQEWVYAPRTMRSRIADGVRAAATLVRRG